MKKILLLLFALVTIGTNAQKKFALVIGNGEYNGKGNGTGYFSKLSPIPENDAKDVGNVLNALGFDVKTVKNAKRDSISLYLADLRSKARGANEVLVYYSGHGAWKNGEYYLVPSGAYAYSETLETDCYSYKALENMVANIQAPLRMIFIDACQNDISGKKGVVRPRTERDFAKNTQAVGLYRFFATSKGEFANLGSEHSIFTGAFLNHIGENGSFDRVWENIRKEVVQKNPDQTPCCIAPESKVSLDEQIRKIVFNPQKVNVNPIARGKQLIRFELNPPTASITFGSKSYNNGTSLEFPLNYPYKFKVEAEGYDPYENTLTATPRTPGVMSINLTKKEEATLKVTSNTPDVQITFDDQQIEYGRTPITLKAYAGTHNLTAKKNGFNTFTATLSLKGGSNAYDIQMSRPKPWFGDMDDYEALMISYHFSPQYQFGISGLWRFYDSRFSLGGHIAASMGALRGWDLGGAYAVANASTATESNSIRTETTSIKGKDCEYSSFIDPYNEAKHHDANALFMVDAGYHVCNGLMFDLGAGLAYHSDKYYMSETYTIKQTVTTNKKTGEVTKTDYSYTKDGDSQWYIQGEKYSPAIRLGAKTFIPLDTFKESQLTVGLGYTYVPMISKISSWDISLGYTRTF